MTCEVIIDHIAKEQWQQFAKEFADYSIYQTWAYQQVRAKMDGQQLNQVVIKNENGSIAMMGHVRIRRIRPLRLAIGYVQWGPLVRSRNGTLRCSMQALKALRDSYLGAEVNVLRIVPNVYDDETGKQLSGMLLSSGFQYVPSFAPYRTFLLDVEDSEEEMRKRLRKSFRRDLRYSEKAGIEIKEGQDGEFCEILEKLYVASRRRKGFRGLDVKEFIETQRMLSTSEKMNIIVAYHDGEVVSAHLASNLGDTAIVLLAASNEQGLSCGSSYLVWYRGAVSALHAGMKLYDLGGIDPDNNPTVYQFKSRMGGKEAFHIGAFEAYASSIAKNTWRAAEKIYRLIKK